MKQKGERRNRENAEIQWEQLLTRRKIRPCDEKICDGNICEELEAAYGENRKKLIKLLPVFEFIYGLRQKSFTMTPCLCV